MNEELEIDILKSRVVLLETLVSRLIGDEKLEQIVDVLFNDEAETQEQEQELRTAAWLIEQYYL